MKIGVFGGAFDPPHCGHLIIAEGVRDQLELGCILFIPYTIGPHRPSGPVAEAEHRLNMLEVSLQDNDAFEVDDRELRRGGISFTVETLRILREDNPDDELVLIVGSDQLHLFTEWRDWEAVLGLAEVAVIERPEFDLTERPAELRDRMVRISLPLMLISSTMVRERVASGRSIRYLVPPAVADYIEEHGLYRCGANSERGL